MLREYTALIDPTEYKPQPMAKAAAPNTKLGVSKPAPKADVAKKNNNKTAKVHGLVKSGDSLSAIAALYRPADVSIHQAWMAFYKLNPKAFPDNNLNRIQKGSQILIPTRAQMTAISQSKAAQEVKKLAKPLSAGGSASTKPSASKTAPKLVVGGAKNKEPAQTKGLKKKPAEGGARTAAADSDQLASIKAEFSAFKQDVTRKLDESRAQTTEAKEQLVAARGQNRVLNSRIVELEKQLSNVSNLLELQEKAVQAIANESAEAEEAQQMVSSGDNAQSIADASDTNQQTLGADRDQAVNEQAQITKSEQRIASLEKELQEKIKLAQTQAQESTEQSATTPTTAIEPEQTQSTVANDTPVSTTQAPTPRVQAEQSFADKTTGALGAVSSTLAGISSDIWKIIGVIAAALLGLFLYSSKRRDREEEFDDEDSFAFSQLEEIGDGTTHDVINHLVGEEDSLPSMQSNQTGDDNDSSALFDLSDESFMASEAVENESSLFAMDEEFGSFGKMASSGGTAGSALQSSIPQMGDVDPVTEAEVYLAYDRKEQALNVLEQALQDNPNQGKVVSKLLSLYKDADDVEAFTRVFESSVENVEDDEQWGDIKQIALDFIPTHKFVDDFDSSIPVLRDELVENAEPEDSNDSKQKETADIEHDAGNQGSDSISLESAAQDDDDLLAAAIQELEEDGAPLSDQSDILTIDDEEPDLDEASMMFVEDELDSVKVKVEDEDASAMDIALENEQDQKDVQAQALDIDAGNAKQEDSGQEADVDLQEVNQHDPETALALAKAYIELGENDIAKDFLKDVINGGSEKIKSEAEELLATVS